MDSNPPREQVINNQTMELRPTVISSHRRGVIRLQMPVEKPNQDQNYLRLERTDY
jgi:hypothetical protein